MIFLNPGLGIMVWNVVSSWLPIPCCPFDLFDWMRIGNFFR